MIRPHTFEYSTPSYWSFHSATSTQWWFCSGYQSQFLWAVLVGISHVKVGYSHPSSCSVAATACSIHVTVDLNRRASTVSGNPVFSRWSVLRDVTARACWVVDCSKIKWLQFFKNRLYVIEIGCYCT